jgi:integrase/recombinase XerD
MNLLRYSTGERVRPEPVVRGERRMKIGRHCRCGRVRPARSPTDARRVAGRQHRVRADSVQSLLAKHVRVASESCPSLASKRVSPHVLRHSAAMELLQAGVDCSVIALWLGHESIETTQTYPHAHLALKEVALAKLKPYERGKRNRFRPNDRLLAFLEAL